MSFHFTLKIGNVKVGTISNASSLNIGRNYLRDFKNMQKTNQGMGNVYGDNNAFPNSTNYVEDPDEQDMIWLGPEDKDSDIEASAEAE